MKGYIVHYQYKRFNKVFKARYVLRTNIIMDNIGINSIKPEIIQKENGIDIEILYIENE